MVADMDAQPRIVIADRSELAGNVYRLLFAPLGAVLVVRKRFEEAKPHFFRREGVKLAIFNSNIFGKKFADIVRHIIDDEPLRKVGKVFICKENPAEVEWRERLARLPGATVVARPFHPDEFLAQVRKLLA